MCLNSPICCVSNSSWISIWWGNCKVVQRFTLILEPNLYLLIITVLLDHSKQWNMKFDYCKDLSINSTYKTEECWEIICISFSCYDHPILDYILSIYILAFPVESVTVAVLIAFIQLVLWYSWLFRILLCSKSYFKYIV